MTTALQCTYLTFVFLGFVLVSIPLPWHWHAQNTATCLYMMWTGLGCLIYFINSVIWSNNAINWAPVWCDITARIGIGLSVAIPISALCINRRLYRLTRLTTVHITNAQKRREMKIDIVLGVGGPLLIMGLQYFVQGHRFNIIEEFGCAPHVWHVWFAFPLILMWPIVIGLISLYYCSRSLYHFIRERSQFKQVLAASTDMSPNRYFRLMCLAGADALCTTPIATWFMVRDAQYIIPYRGWANQHIYFSRVDQFPSILWRQNPYIVQSVELNRWSVVLCAFVFFALFGFTDEARRQYRQAYLSVTNRLGYSKGTMNTEATRSTDMKSNSHPVTFSSSGNPTIIVSKETSSKCDSFGSFDLTIDVGNSFDDHKSPYSATMSRGASSTRSASSVSLSSPANDSNNNDTPESPVARPQPVFDITNVSRRSAESSPIRPSRPASLELGDVV